MTEYYKTKLQSALEYQDFVTIKLHEMCGLNISLMGSQKYQLSVGQSLGGFQIKFDDKFKDTGNLYIEYAEKSDPRNDNYVDSGILRKDNSWMWCIGDYSQAFIIAKKTLTRLYDQATKNPSRYLKKGIDFTQTDTSKGMLVPVSYVKQYMIAKHLVFEGDTHDDT